MKVSTANLNTRDPSILCPRSAAIEFDFEQSHDFDFGFKQSHGLQFLF